MAQPAATRPFDPENPPELAVSQWLNTDEKLSLAHLRGRVVVVVAFQMLCPGCHEHALPQAKRLFERFNSEDVAVIGLHTVFEHHDVMTPAALQVFMHEYKWPFPVAIASPAKDPSAGGVPQVMVDYQMRGTPTLLLFDRAGRVRRHYFGRPEDMLLAAEIMAMVTEDAKGSRTDAANVERKLARALAGPAHAAQGHHHHQHGDDCGCDHDHDHDHSHDHGHHDHGHQAHDHAEHNHGQKTGHKPEAAKPGHTPAAAKDKKPGRGKT